MYVPGGAVRPHASAGSFQRENAPSAHHHVVAAIILVDLPGRVRRVAALKNGCSPFVTPTNDLRGTFRNVPETRSFPSPCPAVARSACSPPTDVLFVDLHKRGEGANCLFIVCCEESARTGASRKNACIELDVRSPKSFADLH